MGDSLLDKVIVNVLQGVVLSKRVLHAIGEALEKLSLVWSHKIVSEDSLGDVRGGDEGALLSSQVLLLVTSSHEFVIEGRQRQLMVSSTPEWNSKLMKRDEDFD